MAMVKDGELSPIWKDIFSLIDHLDGLVKGLNSDYDDYDSYDHYDDDDDDYSDYDDHDDDEKTLTAVEFQSCLLKTTPSLTVSFWLWLVSEKLIIIIARNMMMTMTTRLTMNWRMVLMVRLVTIKSIFTW